MVCGWVVGLITLASWAGGEGLAWGNGERPRFASSCHRFDSPRSTQRFSLDADKISDKCSGRKRLDIVIQIHLRLNCESTTKN